jgi:glucose/arabinose dehydrogenase
MAILTGGSGIGAVAILLLMAAAVTAACSTGSDHPSGDLERGGPGPGDPIVTGDAPTHAEFGLDARPSNTTCLAPPRPPSVGELKLERVFANVNLQHIMAMAQPPGDGSRWFVANRWGTIWSFPTESPPNQPRLVADLPAVAQKTVATELSGGLLGFAFHPSFASNGRLYVTFTTRSGGGYASEVGYLTSADGGASFTSYRKVFDFRRANLEYNGGGIAFGADGDLYLAFGAAGNDAQRTDNYFGTIVRLDVDHPADGRPYGIPSSNPFRHGGGAPEIFAWGFRNPFRLSIDRESGELWVGDVGHARYEEIDRVEVGKNYGWPCREGAHDRWRAACASDDVLVDPTFEYAHGPGGACVTGGVVYRGAAMPALQGTYVYADFMSLEVSTLSFDAASGAAISTPIEGGPSRGFTHFAEDEDGEIYVSTVSDHEIYKLVPANPSAGSELPALLS